MHKIKRKKKYIYRSAVTGELVTKAYAVKHPTTTVREEVTKKA